MVIVTMVIQVMRTNVDIKNRNNNSNDNNEHADNNSRGDTETIQQRKQRKNAIEGLHI